MTPIDIFGLMREIASNPDDDSLYQMYADYLEESGNEIKARLVRGTTIEPQYKSKRGRSKYEIIYQPEHSNYYKVHQLMEAYPELCLNGYVNRKMYCSQRETRFTFRWRNCVTGTKKSVLLLERGLVREMWLDMGTFMTVGAKVIASNPIKEIHIINKEPRYQTRESARWYKYGQEQFGVDHAKQYLPHEIYQRLNMFEANDDDVGFSRRYSYGGHRVKLSSERAIRDLRQACLSYGIDQAKQLLGIA